jgi:hypothetical protein
VPGRLRGRALGLAPPVLASLVLACSVLIGCAELKVPLPQDLGSLVGPPQKRFEGVPAHEAAPPVAEPGPTVAPALAMAPAATRAPLKDVRELIGLERHEIQARLGDPALRRRDAPAEIWQYRSPLCVLDVFLYRDGPAMRVTNAELRPRDGRELPATTCLSSL